MKQPDFTSDIGIGMLWVQGVRISTLSESDKRWAEGKRLSIRTAAVHPDSLEEPRPEITVLHLEARRSRRKTNKKPRIMRPRARITARSQWAGRMLAWEIIRTSP